MSFSWIVPRDTRSVQPSSDFVPLHCAANLVVVVEEAALPPFGLPALVALGIRADDGLDRLRDACKTRPGRPGLAPCTSNVLPVIQPAADRTRWTQKGPGTFRGLGYRCTCLAEILTWQRLVKDLYALTLS